MRGVAGWQRTADQAVQLGQTFAAALGTNRVRPVLCGQGTNMATLQAGWQYLLAHYPQPNTLIYGMAVAPYAPLVPTLAQNDWRVQLLGGPHVTAFETLCNQYGVASCCYEGGVDLSNTGISTTTQDDPRMEKVLGWYLKAWRGTGVFNYYDACSEARTYYGLTTDPGVISPKVRAAAAFSASLNAAK